jgi:hypothetical protein
MDGQALPDVTYTIGDDVLTQATDSGAGQHLLYDGHGSARQLIASDGSTVDDSFSYDAYGVMLGGNPGPGSSPATNLLYTGEYFDTDMQQYYLRARWYDQQTGCDGLNSTLKFSAAGGRLMVPDAAVWTTFSFTTALCPKASLRSLRAAGRGYVPLRSQLNLFDDQPQRQIINLGTQTSWRMPGLTRSYGRKSNNQLRSRPTLKKLGAYAGKWHRPCYLPNLFLY